MIKFIVAAIWLAGATLASVYFSFSSAKTHAVDEKPQPTLLGGLDYVSMPLASIPLMAKGDVYGYFIAKFVYTAEPAKLAKLVVPPEALMMDEVYTWLYANPQLNFAQAKELDLDQLRSSVKEAINKRVGDELIHEVLIEQVDFLSKQDIRDNTSRRKLSAIEAEEKRNAAAAAEAQKAAKGGSGGQ